ncbi:hypothetical protein EZV62_019928 [Acer yangbiense]|uniref:UspA domain-containing protein n=1 Tax=Acer yangbiense TaxID=1000413 RepID=A0A5C7HDV6_9ROSI|nr:hypothetical protein EZV62_019928 [Acer yangbiense]
MESEPTRVLLAVSESTIKGYPHASISSRGAFEWTIQKIVRSNTSGFRLHFLHVQVPDEDGSLYLSLSWLGFRSYLVLSRIESQLPVTVRIVVYGVEFLVGGIVQITAFWFLEKVSITVFTWLLVCCILNFLPLGFDDMDSIYASPEDFKNVKQRDRIRGLHLLEYFVNRCHEIGLDCKSWIKKGDPKEVICREVQRVQPDLLVVGSRGLGPFQRVFVGTVSEFCVKHAECPVITIKRRADETPQDPVDD